MKQIKYLDLLDNIGHTIAVARQNAFKAVNSELVKSNWELGKYIVEFEQHGKHRAVYGNNLLTKLSKDLKLRFGNGFGRRNVLDMRRFYFANPKWQTVSVKLSWSNYIVLLGISNETVLKSILDNN